MSRILRAAAVVDYPCSDDRPMAESDFQRVPLMYLLTVLETHFLDRSDVYVAGDLFVYYEEGNPGAVVAPDVFVVMGAEKRLRHSYKLWEEPKGPDFVLEVVSASTRAVDLDEKPELYASLGVQEYWLFDPTGESYAPQLCGMRLVAGRYQELPPKASGLGPARGANPIDGKTVASSVLGLDVRVEPDGTLRLCNPVTGEGYAGYAGERDARMAAETAARQEAEARARQETAARKAAEAQVAELQARLRELQGRDSPPGDGTRA